MQPFYSISFIFKLKIHITVYIYTVLAYHRCFNCYFLTSPPPISLLLWRKKLPLFARICVNNKSSTISLFARNFCQVLSGTQTDHSAFHKLLHKIDLRFSNWPHAFGLARSAASNTHSSLLIYISRLRKLWHWKNRVEIIKPIQSAQFFGVSKFASQSYVQLFIFIGIWNAFSL